MSDKSETAIDVAIVGGGFSGTMLAVHLAGRGIRAALIDGSGRMGRGVAYSTSDPAHLLNVPSAKMSAWPDQPDHFADFIRGAGVGPQDFAQRQDFGRYLETMLADAERGGLVRPVESRAVEASREGERWRLSLANDGAVEARALVLATGNAPPCALAAFADAGDRFVTNPWGAEARGAVAALTDSGRDALIIGTGLTMVDIAISLDAAGYQGRITAISRRGQMPRAHAAHDAAPVTIAEVPLGSLRELTRWLRERSAKVGWRAAVDSLRPHSHAIWQSLNEADQRRFLRHARPWWDVHRHRIAPQIAKRLVAMIGDGRLAVVAGRIRGVANTGDGLDVSVMRRGAHAIETYQVAYAFNSTGPLHEIAGSHDPLFRSLLDAGAIAPDPLGLAVAVTDHGRVDTAPCLWALGALTKGRYWEIVAVPDIRDQVAAVAADIARELGR